MSNRVFLSAKATLADRLLYVRNLKLLQHGICSHFAPISMLAMGDRKSD